MALPFNEQLIKSLHDRLPEHLSIQSEEHLRSFLLAAFSERGKPLNEEDVSFWSELTFLIGECFSIPQDVYNYLAISFEIALLSGDIFDDIMDQDNLETTWGRLSLSDALCVANWLYTQSYSIIVHTPTNIFSSDYKTTLLKSMTHYISEAMVGQWQEQKLNSLNMTEDDYFRYINLKSGKLVEMIFVCMAHYDSKYSSDINKFAAIGQRIGIALQIRNDTFDILSTLKSDLVELKPNLPLLKGIEHSLEKGDSFFHTFQSWHHKQQLNEQRESIHQYLLDCGAMDYSKVMYLTFLNEAGHQLDLLQNKFASKNSVEKLKQFIGCQ